MIIAMAVATCSPTMKARYGESGADTLRSFAHDPPTSAGMRMLCPRLDSGNSSVTPWRRPTIPASPYVRCDMPALHSPRLMSRPGHRNPSRRAAIKGGSRPLFRLSYLDIHSALEGGYSCLSRLRKLAPTVETPGSAAAYVTAHAAAKRGPVSHEPPPTAVRVTRVPKSTRDSTPKAS